MDENFKNFNKFKKRIWLDIIIQCICFGLAAGLLAAVAVLLPCKLFGVNLLWIFYVLIALGGCAIGGGVSFLVLRTDDKKIAKRLDAELKLAERVQTAGVYSSQDGEMLDLQRVDANNELGKYAVKELHFENIVATVLSAVIAVGAVVSLTVIATLVQPVFASSETEIPPEERPRPVTDWEWAALDDLINYVKASKKADTVVKTGIVLELEGLRAVLLDGVSSSSLSMFVQNTVSNIRNVVKDANERGINDEQQTANSEEESYVINKLYEIFSLSSPDGNGNGDNSDNDGNGGENEDDDTDNPGDDAKWELNVNDVPFFDPEKGYVTISDIREEYYERVQAAFNEGTLSREEWEYIMVTYFADLSNKDQ